MRNAIRRSWGNEIAKTVRSKLAWFGFAAVAVLCSIISVVADQVPRGSTVVTPGAT